MVDPILSSLCRVSTFELGRCGTLPSGLRPSFRPSANPGSCCSSSTRSTRNPVPLSPISAVSSTLSLFPLRVSSLADQTSPTSCSVDSSPPPDRPTLPFFRLQLDRYNEAQLSNNTSFSDFLPWNSLRRRCVRGYEASRNLRGYVPLRSYPIFSSSVFFPATKFLSFSLSLFFPFSFLVRSTRWFLTRITSETATTYKRFRFTVGLERERGAKKWEIGYSRWEWCVLFARPYTFHRSRWTAYFVSFHPD